jgi:hypothetical protein
VGIEATGSMQWFVELMEVLGIDCQVGHPARIRAAAPRKQKHDRRESLNRIRSIDDVVLCRAIALSSESI